MNNNLRRNLIIANINGGGRLPTGLQEVEYLKVNRSGTYAYIDTDENDFESSIECVFKMMSSNYECVIGVGNYPEQIIGATWLSDFVFNGTRSGIERDTQAHSIVLNPQNIVLDGIEYDITRTIPRDRFGIFTGMYASRAGAGTTVSLIKIYNDDAGYYREIIPCYYKSTNEVGMYDTRYESFIHFQYPERLGVGPDV